MARKRIRIDVEDTDGTKYDIKLEGNVTRDKILKVFEMMDLMNIEEGTKTTNLDTIGAKILNIIDKHFPIGKFTSNEILEKYEDEYNEPIKLSVVSTYLSRFNSKGKIERSKSGRAWAYQTIKLTQKRPTN
jgi:hypothetical protein